MRVLEGGSNVNGWKDSGDMKTRNQTQNVKVKKNGKKYFFHHHSRVESTSWSENWRILTKKKELFFLVFILHPFDLDLKLIFHKCHVKVSVCERSAASWAASGELESSTKKDERASKVNETSKKTNSQESWTFQTTFAASTLTQHRVELYCHPSPASSCHDRVDYSIEAAVGIPQQQRRVKIDKKSWQSFSWKSIQKKKRVKVW